MSMPMPMLLSPSASSASETESDADTDADVDPTQVLLAAGTQSRLRRRPAVAVHPARQVRLPDAGVPGTTLFCGAEIELGGGEEEEWWDAHRPAVPRFLPDDSEVAPPPQPHRVRKSTGCGARVHASAHSARAGGRWVGAVQGVEGTVVRLESGYFAERDRAALGIAGAGCGCNIEGVGCAICGNALGALHTPCRVHQARKGPSHYVFLPDSVSPPIKDAADASQSFPADRTTPRANDENLPPAPRARTRTDDSLWERPIAAAAFSNSNSGSGSGRGSGIGDQIWQAMYPAAAVQELPRPRPRPRLQRPTTPPFGGHDVGVPRTPPPNARARTPPDAAELARIDAHLAAMFSRGGTGSGTGSGVGVGGAHGDLTAPSVFMLSGDGDEMRITPPPPAPTALDTPVRRRPTTPEHVRPRMEVDEATTPATPAPLVVAEFPASPSTPSSDRDSPPPLIPTPDDDLPFAEAIRDDASADADAEASNAPMDLEPLVFSTPPTEPASASPSTSPTPVVHDAAVDEQTRAQIMAMFAQRWERAPVTLEHTHTRAPSPMPMPPTLSRSASTSTSTSTSTTSAPAPARSLRRTFARPDLHSAASARARRPSAPGLSLSASASAAFASSSSIAYIPAAGASTSSTASTSGSTSTSTSTSTASASSSTTTAGTSTAGHRRFPTLREQEAWLAAEVGRRPLRRASVPDLRRRAGAGAGAGASTSATAAMMGAGGAAMVRRVVGRLRGREAEGAGAGASATGSGPSEGAGDEGGGGDAGESDGDTVRAVEDASTSTPSNSIFEALGIAGGEPLHITRARERLLARDRHRVEMLRVMREQRANVIEYTDVTGSGSGSSGAGNAAGGSGSASAGAGASGGAGAGAAGAGAVRARPWFER